MTPAEFHMWVEERTYEEERRDYERRVEQKRRALCALAIVRGYGSERVSANDLYRAMTGEDLPGHLEREESLDALGQLSHDRAAKKLEAK
jgi:hypothetical protein